MSRFVFKYYYNHAIEKIELFLATSREQQEDCSNIKRLTFWNENVCFSSEYTLNKRVRKCCCYQFICSVEHLYWKSFKYLVSVLIYIDIVDQSIYYHIVNILYITLTWRVNTGLCLKDLFNLYNSGVKLIQ